MKLIFTFCLFFLSFAVSGQPPKVKAAEIGLLTGPEFSGTATIVNEDSELKKTVPVKLSVVQDPEIKNSWNLNIDFPDNPIDNETQTIKLVSGGRYINDQEITTRTVTDAGLIKITAEEIKDDRTFVYRYLIGKDSLNFKVVEKTGPDTFRPIRAYDVKR